MGKIIEYKTIYTEEETNYGTKVVIQRSKGARENKKASDFVQVLNWITPKSQKWGFTMYAPSYAGIKVILRELVDIHGKEEVERELEVKIDKENKCYKETVR